MSRKQRRSFSAEQKVAVVRRHLVEGVPVSDLCDEQQISPTQFYQWQKQLFENGCPLVRGDSLPEHLLVSVHYRVE